jgi:hypothetical protein
LVRRTADIDKLEGTGASRLTHIVEQARMLHRSKQPL